VTPTHDVVDHRGQRLRDHVRQVPATAEAARFGMTGDALLRRLAGLCHQHPLREWTERRGWETDEAGFFASDVQDPSAAAVFRRGRTATSSGDARDDVSGGPVRTDRHSATAVLRNSKETKALPLHPGGL